MRTLMDSLNAVLNREEGYLFDYDRLRAVLSKQDREDAEEAVIAAAQAKYGKGR